MQERSAGSTYVVPMVEHALRILEVLAGSNTALRLKEVGSKAQVGPTSAFRILRTLANLGYIAKDEATGRYRLTTKMRELAKWAQLSPNLHQAARPHLERLRAQFDETVNLAVLQDGEIVYLDILQSSKAFRMADTVGSRVPIHATALGKAIAAHVPKERLEGILSHCSWTRYTPRTITKRRDFLSALVKVQKQGYGSDNDESEHGASCIASAILSPSTGHAAAGISVSGPSRRIRAKRKGIIEGLKQASSAIARSLD
ncbi:MAG: IclR family transcriptional regulator [Terriglobia bacterium]